MNTPTSIRLVSHPGKRARDVFDQTVTPFDTSKLTRLATITEAAHKDSWGDDVPRRATTYWLNEDERLLRSTSIASTLGDAEVGEVDEDGVLTIFFDGDYPGSNDGGCFVPPVLITPTEVFTREHKGGVPLLFASTYKKSGRNPWARATTHTQVEFSSPSDDLLPESVNADPGFDTSRYGKPRSRNRKLSLLDVRSPEIVEALAKDGISVEVHDDRVLDAEALLAARAERAKTRLDGYRKELAKASDALDKVLSGEDVTHVPMVHCARDDKMNETAQEFIVLRSLIRNLDQPLHEDARHDGHLR